MMIGHATYQELIHQLSEVGAVRKGLVRRLPPELSAGSAGVLTMLRRHGDMTMSELTELLAVDISVTSRHVACVADQGWIERSPNPADGRSRILRLTDAGRDLLDNASHQLTDLIADRLSGWDESDVHELVRLVTKLRDSLGHCGTTSN
ncbi:MarR family winged helix-turn-helix transcriptional regulator [Nocardioides sp. YIM B13467]|uniref:MarR family winged helix-turn-helix transcriptional regulator n=1 Tax=Nocardioides sp. YIM B13467 TaxID=3366294 RepID=UPI00366CF536